MAEYKNYSCGPLMAVDALGRPTVDRNEAPAPRKDRLVGLFYFLWLGECGRHKPYNVSEIVAKDPEAGYKPKSDIWGGVGCYHHWGEPFYGYYYSEDEWVIRHHMKLLIQADIDFLYFDTTNAVVYEKNCMKVMKVLQEYHEQGWKIPKVMFYTNTESGKTVQEIYDNIYKINYCPDTWFCLDGKPVIIAVKEECSEETRNFFNIKMSQWPNEPDKLGGWPWMDFTRPQRVFANLDGVPEVINVSVAQHPQLRFGDSVLYGETTNCGRAFHNGENDKDPNGYLYGYNFSEQFERAIETDPPIVLVTGWNEWIAGYWPGIPERPVMFVDCANYEYSRDLEMMRGGYFDNYYMQLVSYVRRYKGVCDNKTFKALPKPEAGKAEKPTFAHYCGFADGDFSRNCEGSGTVYTNYTQRNVVTDILLNHDDQNLYFTIIGKKPITDYDGQGTWMKLFINTDCGAGYNFVLNNNPRANGVTTLAKLSPEANYSEAEDIHEAVYRFNETRQIMFVAVPRKALGLENDKFTIRFKWADSTETINTVEDFYDKGDAAPLGRLDFVYNAE